MKRSTQLIIGIGGISQSGKSTLSRGLKKELLASGLTVKIFEIDHYTVEKELIPKVKDRLDWEHPDSIDWERLVAQIKKATADVIIVEGIFAFNPKLLPFYSKKIQIDLDHDTFFERRKKEIRWGEEPAWYLDHVWETNQNLVKSVTSDLRLRSDGIDNVQQVLAMIKKKLPTKNQFHG